MIALDTCSSRDKGPYLALETDNIEKEPSRLRKRGVPVVLDIRDNKICKMAFSQDPSGHAIMIHQMEPGRMKALNASKAGGSSTKKPAAKRKPARTARKKAPKAAKATGRTKTASKTR